MIILNSARKHGISDFEMNDDVNVIWKKGEGEIPGKAKKAAWAAQGELLLKTLHLSPEMACAIRDNADKNAQTVTWYISAIVMERLRSCIHS